MIQDNYQFFYLSEPFTLARFNMRHPVVDIISLRKQNLPTIVQTVTLCRIFWHDMRKLTNDDDFKGYLVEGSIKKF